MSSPEASPRVSVIVIFLDEETFLGEAIESVVAQDIDDWELLLCDDGSTDASVDIARGYAEADSRITVLTHPGGVNRGMSATRNLGLRHASAPFVALLDADDTWAPRKLRRQLEMIAGHPDVAMVCGPSLYWRSWADGVGTIRDRIMPVGAVGTSVVEPPELLLGLYPLGEGGAPCPSSLLIRRTVALDLGGFEEHFTEHRQLYEDQGFLSKLYLQHPVLVSDECLNNYRQRDDSCVATVTADGGYERVRAYFLDWLGRYMDEHGIDDQRVRRALESAS